MKISTPAAKAVFAKHYLFGQLSLDELDELLARARIERYRAGETIFLNQSEGRGMMAVLAGQVRISTMSSNGRELVLNTIDAGEVFGELALLDGKERTADAIAVTESELLVLERSEFIPFLEKRPALAMRLLAIIAGRLRQTTTQAADVALLGLEKRLAKHVLRLAGRQGRTRGRSVVIQEKYTQRQLGQMVGASRESINKQFAAWQRRGITRFDKGIITVLEPAALQGLVDGD
jgi:CRP/FNR family transcriptional regulator, cyclic AMP receptor protein